MNRNVPTHPFRSIPAPRTNTMDLNLTPFIMHETYGLKKFEQLLRDDVYCTVAEAFAQTYAVLAQSTTSVSEDGEPIVGAPIQVK